MNMPEMNIEEWQKPDGFLSFRHNTHPDYLNGFGDNVDTTAIWLTQCKMNQTKTDAEIKGILTAGLDRRAVIEQGVVVKVVRTPGDPQEIGKDQLDYLVPLCRSLGLTRWADRLVDLYGDTKLPHRRDHLKGSNTFFGMLFEMADSIIDRWSNSMPSKMNNLSRLLWKAYNGKPNKIAIKLFRKLDPWFIMVVYCSRTPELIAGKSRKEAERLHRELFDEVTKNGANKMSPVPAYQGYKLIIDLHL